LAPPGMTVITPRTGDTVVWEANIGPNRHQVHEIPLTDLQLPVAKAEASFRHETPTCIRVGGLEVKVTAKGWWRKSGQEQNGRKKDGP